MDHCKHFYLWLSPTSNHKLGTHIDIYLSKKYIWMKISWKLLRFSMIWNWPMQSILGIDFGLPATTYGDLSWYLFQVKYIYGWNFHKNFDSLWYHIDQCKQFYLWLSPYQRPSNDICDWDLDKNYLILYNIKCNIFHLWLSLYQLE